MPSSRKNMVEISKGCHKVPVMGKVYLYYQTGSHKNNNGQNINERVSIGRLDEETGKLIPNEKYCYYFPKVIRYFEPTTILKCGSYAVIKRISDDLGLEDILKNCFGENASKILSLAQFMIRYGKAKLSFFL